MGEIVSDRARAVVEQVVKTTSPAVWVGDLMDTQSAQRWIDAIATALLAERAAVWREAASLVERGAFVFQSDPPLPVTTERLEELRAQIAATLRARGTSEG